MRHREPAPRSSFLLLLAASVLGAAASFGCSAREAPPPGPTGTAEPAADEAETAAEETEADAADGVDVDAAAADAAERPRFGFRPPRELPESGYQLVGSQRFEEGGVSFGLRYHGPDRPLIDLFLIPRFPPDRLPDEAARKEFVESHFAMEMQAIETHADQEGWDLSATEPPSTVELDTPSGPRTARYQRMEISTEERGLRDSHLLVYMVGGTIVKVRATFAEAEVEEGLGHLQGFLPELAREMYIGEIPDPEGPAAG